MIMKFIVSVVCVLVLVTGPVTGSAATVSYGFDGTLADYLVPDLDRTSDPDEIASLTQSNGRFEFVSDSGGHADYWFEWIAQTIPQDRDWRAVGTFYIADILAPDHTSLDFGFQVINGANGDDNATFKLVRYPYTTVPVQTADTKVMRMLRNNGVGAVNVDQFNIPVQPVLLRLRYQSAAPSLRYDYSLDEGANWTTLHPSDASIFFGETATLSVGVTGDNATFQWYRGTSGDTSQPIAGAENAQYTTPPLEQTTHYWVRVTGINVVDSEAATVTVAGATGPVITQHPQDTAVPLGDTAELTVSDLGTGSISYQWYAGTSGATNEPVPGGQVATFITPPITEPTTFWVRVTDDNGSADSDAATVSVLGTLNPGEPDTTYNYNGSVGHNGTDGNVRKVHVQADGRPILVGGFNQVDTPAGWSTGRGRIARFSTTGELDTTFNAGGTGANDTIRDVHELPDGRFLIHGYFTTFNGVARNGIAVLNADGSLDTDTVLNFGGSRPYGICSAIQPDGKILIGGDFDSFNGEAAYRIVRLNADLSHDTSFNAASGLPSSSWLGVETIAVQSDGKILYTQHYNGGSGSLWRLHANGTADVTFNGGDGIYASIWSLAVRKDDRIYIGGRMSSVHGEPRHGIARLLPDGALDTTFVPPVIDFIKYWGLTKQRDGGIMAAGQTTSPGGTRLHRYLPDGSLDPAFDTGTMAPQYLTSFTQTPDGQFGYIAGFFTGFYVPYDFTIRHSARIYAPTAPAILQFAAPTQEVVAGAGTVEVTVTMSGTLLEEFTTVTFATVDGTAEAGTDYTAVSGTLTFSNDAPTQVVSVPVAEAVSGDVTFSITLGSTGEGAILGATDQVTVTIITDAGELDTDGDGIPDWWEIEHFGGATNAVATAWAANEVNTLLEAYIAGLDPHDPAASLSVAAEADATEGFTLRWDAIPGRLYNVYRALNLMESNPFVLLESDISDGAFTDAEPVDAPQRFYRISVRLE